MLGFALGVGLAAARLSKNPVLQTISWTYVWAFRSIPLIVQLLFWFNIAYLYQTLSVGVPFGPSFVTIDVNNAISGMAAATLGLGLHQAASSAEIIRAGILSVDRVSWKPLPRWASRSVGSSSRSFCRRPCGASCPMRPMR